MNPRSIQRGATLITALVMLVVLTLLVISAMKSSTTNMRITGNMQVQEEAVSAAQQGVEAVMSNDFTKTPTNSDVQVTYGGQIYIAHVKKPVCTGSTPLVASTPNLARGCYQGDEYTPDATGYSLCSAQRWTFESHVDDPSTAASATVHQGAAALVTNDTTC